MKKIINKFYKIVIFVLLSYSLVFIVYIANHALWLKKLPQKDEILRKNQFSWLQLRTPSYQNLLDVAQGKIPPERIRTYLAYYNQVMDQTSAKADVYQLMGYCHFYLKQYDQAKTFYQMAYNTHRHIFWFAHNLGVISLLQGRYREAQDYFLKAQQMKLNFSLSFMMDDMRAYPRIVAFRIIDFDKLNKQILQGLAKNAQGLMLCYYYLKEYDDMLQLAARVIQTNLSNKDIFNFYMGVAFYQLERYPLALKYFNSFISTEPDAWEGYYYLALTLNKIGRKKEADIFLEKAKELQEKHPPILLDPYNFRIGFF